MLAPGHLADGELVPILGLPVPKQLQAPPPLVEGDSGQPGPDWRGSGPGLGGKISNLEIPHEQWTQNNHELDLGSVHGAEKPCKSNLGPGLARSQGLLGPSSAGKLPKIGDLWIESGEPFSKGAHGQLSC